MEGGGGVGTGTGTGVVSGGNVTVVSNAASPTCPTGPVERWGGREQLWLAAAVARGGGWNAVSRALRACGLPDGRCSARRCAQQYAALQARRPTEGPHALLHQLTRDRVQQLHHLMAEETRVYAKLLDEVRELTSNGISEARVRTMAAAVEQEQLLPRTPNPNTNALRQARTRPAASTPTTPTAPAPSPVSVPAPAATASFKQPDKDNPHASPLLTSLLQSTVPVNQQLSDTAESPNDRVTAIIKTDDILSDADGSAEKVPYHDLEKIEQIKSELQKIEQNLMDGTSPVVANVLDVIAPLHAIPGGGKDPTAGETFKHGEKVDIDDIEIKDEDVYAFSDIDLDIPPVSSIHKSSLGRTMSSDKNLFNKRDPTANASDDAANGDGARLANILSGEPPADDGSFGNVSAPDGETVDEDAERIQTEAATGEVIEDSSSAAEVKSTADSENDAKPSIETEKSNNEDDDSDGEMNRKVSEIKRDLEAKKSAETETREPVRIDGDNVSSEKKTAESPKKETPTHTIVIEEIKSELTESHIETDDDTPIEVSKEDKPGKTKRDYSRKKAEKEDTLSPSKDLDNLIVPKLEYSDEIGSDNSQEAIDKRLVKKLRNDLSGSRSESPATPVDSLPNSPAPGTPPLHASHSSSHSTSEQDKDYRIWKKSVSLVLNRLCALKYASVFQRPITDEQAPRYSQVVKKPMDLTTIRRNIDLGVIKTTREFQRDVLLMLTNALMYNRTDHRVYSMARDTMKEAITELNLLLQAQEPTADQTPTLSRLTRPPRPASRTAGPPVKRKRGGGSSDTPISKKRKTDEN